MDKHQQPPSMQKLKLTQYVTSFIVGGISSAGTVGFVQPLDYVKVQIQLRSQAFANKGIQHLKSDLSPFRIFRQILKDQGFKQFFVGFPSQIIRNLTYTTTSLALYKIMIDKFLEKFNRNANILEANFMALISGSIGGFVGTPFDVCLIRIQSDQMFPEQLRRNYKNLFDALFRIIKEEGFKTLFRGTIPTMLRASAISLGMNAPYNHLKNYFKLKQNLQHDTLWIQTKAGAIAGTFCAFYALPFDNCKTKLQQMKAINGVNPYKGVIDCMIKTIQKEGPFRLWVGLPIFYWRVAPHALMAKVVQDWCYKLINAMNNNSQSVKQ